MNLLKSTAFLIIAPLLSQLSMNAQFSKDHHIKNLQELNRSALQKNSSPNEQEMDIQQHALSALAMPTVEIEKYEERRIEIPSVNAGDLPRNWEPKVQISISRKIPTAYIYCNTLRQKNGEVYALKNIKYRISESTASLSKTESLRSYASNSVLASKKFYKIAVESDDVYRIDYAFLAQHCGLSGSISSGSIQVYGNGGQMLSWDLSIVPADDLQEVPIHVVDQGDGTLDAGDYILFFGTGPNKSYWDNSDKLYRHQLNKYEDRSYYFITLNGQNNKRISTATPASNTGLSTDKFYAHKYRHEDSTVLERVGGYWFGDVMKYGAPTRQFVYAVDHPYPGSNTSLYLRSAYYSSKSDGQIRLSVDNTQVDQNSYAHFPVHYGYPVVSYRDHKHTMPVQSQHKISLSATLHSFSDLAYMNFLDLTIPRKLTTALSSPCIIRNPEFNSSSQSLKFEFDGTLSASLQIWDVKDIHQTLSIPVQTAAGKSYFVGSTADDSQYLLLDPSTDGMAPTFVEEVSSQNLHAHSPVDLIIVSPKEYLAQAENLGTHRRNKDGVSYRVVDLKQIYNEFGGGSQDPVAIRDYAKMLYDKASTSGSAPKNLLLFGDASYDYKNRTQTNQNLVPTYESPNLRRIDAFNTDDYYGFLDDNENPKSTQAQSLDVGVGRIPFNDQTKLNNVLQKIYHYESPASFGSWRMLGTFTADNQDDGNLVHFRGAEQISDTLQHYNDILNIDKVYGDAYPIQSTAGGARIPEFNTKLNALVNQGSLFVNYTGHGGTTGLGQEGFVTLNDINSWKNPDNLPIFITATCDFSKFDFPDLYAAGERILMESQNGGVALITTTQDVYGGPNRILNRNYLKHQYRLAADGIMSIGEAWRLSKNDYYNHSPTETTNYNYQKFSLLGDPSMKPAFPRWRVVVDSVLSIPTGQKVDTLKALGRYTMYGHISDPAGSLQTDFSGLVYPKIYDKSQTFRTTQQVSNSSVLPYELRKSLVFNGKAQVQDGRFETSFVLPKDIQYNYGQAKISTYATAGDRDAGGAYYRYTIGGEDSTAADDDIGPELDGFLNDENFVDGGITHPDPVLILKLEDYSGINTTGSSIGHDLIAVLDDDQSSPHVLNNYYEADANDYTKGTVRYPFYDLEPGDHHLDIKVWDGANNSSSLRLNFKVVNQNELELTRVYNYPNPFSTKTSFMFEHNYPNDQLKVQINIYTLTGKLVNSINQEVNTSGTRIADIAWNGRDAYGEKIANGSYLYTLKVKTSTGKKAEKMEKLYIIQ